MSYGYSVGRSINAQNTDAVTASEAARAVGGGCKAGWVGQFVPSHEWHHCDRAVGDGRPIDFYDLDLARELWAAWLARDDQAMASTFADAANIGWGGAAWEYDDCPSVREIEAWFSEQAAARRAVRTDPRIGRRAEITIREYERKRGAWRLLNERTFPGVIFRITPSGLAEIACDDGAARRGKTWRMLDEVHAAV